MTSAEALANLQTAMQDYRMCRDSLAHHRGLAKHGLANNLAAAIHSEHSALHRLERAQAAYAALQPPPTPKPTTVPKIVATAASVKPLPFSAAKPAAPSFAEAKRDADRAREEYQAAMRRQDEAHERAVAAYQARPATPLSQRKF